MLCSCEYIKNDRNVTFACNYKNYFTLSTYIINISKRILEEFEEQSFSDVFR